MESMSLKGVLYIVSTPIGNLRDITLRAIDTLKEVDWIAAEDTRHSTKLLDHFSIRTPVFSLHEHNESARLNHIKSLLDEGKSIALISDAGTPLISDPGYFLVSTLRQEGYEILTVPGASALIAGLSVSGLPSNRFYFEGFLPVKSKQRRERLLQLKNVDATVICYEAPHRIMDLLQEISDLMGGDRRVCIARELTKKFETVKLSGVDDLIAMMNVDHQQQKGEFVVIIESANKDGKKGGDNEIAPETMQLLKQLADFLPPKKAAQLVSDFSGVSKKQLYDLLLKLKNQ